MGDIPVPNRGRGCNNGETLSRLFTVSFSPVAHLQVYRMYHIYNKNALVCVIPSITTTGLFGESTPPSRLLLPLTQFRSYRVRSDKPPSGSHNTVRHKDTR